MQLGTKVSQPKMIQFTCVTCMQYYKDRADSCAVLCVVTILFYLSIVIITEEQRSSSQSYWLTSRLMNVIMSERVVLFFWRGSCATDCAVWCTVFTATATALQRTLMHSVQSNTLLWLVSVTSTILSLSCTGILQCFSTFWEQQKFEINY